jgi:hypothetical protein
MILPTSIFSLVEHFGVSLTTTSVRVIGINKQGKIVKEAEEISKAPFIDGDTVSQELLAELLQKAIKKAQITKKHAAVCLPEKVTYSREYTLPHLPLSEVQEAVNWQLGTIFPFKPEEIYADWKLLSQTSDATNVVVVAISKLLLDGIRQAFETAGIKPISFEPSASALARMITSTASSTIILELDGQGLSASLVRQGVSSLTTTNTFAGATTPDDILATLTSSVQSIVKRAQKTQLETTNNTWDVCITGEKAAAKLTEALSKKCELPCRILPIANCEPANHVAYVAAYSSVQPPESEKTINLLPDILQTEYHLEAELVQARTATTLGIVITSIALIVAITANMSNVLLGLTTPPENSMVAPSTQNSTLNVALLMKKAQQITTLQVARKIPTNTMREVMNICKNADVRQFTYDASKKEIRIAIASIDRTALFEIKNALEASGRVAKVNIPLSALSSEEAGDTVLSMTVKDITK